MMLEFFLIILFFLGAFLTLENDDKRAQKGAFFMVFATTLALVAAL